jgi:hypothetical protein
MPDLITINEAASRLDVLPGEVSRLISRGVLSTVILVDADSLPVKSS